MLDVISRELLIDMCGYTTYIYHPGTVIAIVEMVRDILDFKTIKILSHKDKGNRLMVTAILEEGSIVIHTCPERSYCRFDLSSRKELGVNIDNLATAIASAFGAKTHSFTEHTRPISGADVECRRKWPLPS